MADFTKLELKELIREVARETARETLRGLGADVDHPLEMQNDFVTLRSWRKAMDAVRNKILLTVVGVIVIGVLGAIWVGIDSYRK